MKDLPTTSCADTDTQLLTAIPHILGHRPHEDLVLLARDRRGAVVMTARTSLADTLPDVDAAAAALGPIIAADPRSGITDVYLVAAESARAGLDDELSRFAAALAGDQRLPVAWVGRIRDGGWSSLACADACCHQLPDPATSHHVAAAVANGRQVTASREAITAEVQPTGSPVASLRRPADVPKEAWRDATIDAALTVLAAAGPAPDDGAVAVIAAACADIRVRDTVLYRLTYADPATGQPGWHEAWNVCAAALRRLDGTACAAVAGVAAVTAWQLGDGTRARVALDRGAAAAAAVGEQPTSLAGLLDRSLQVGLAPRTWVDLMDGLTEHQCRHGSQAHTPADIDPLAVDPLVDGTHSTLPRPGQEPGLGR